MQPDLPGASMASRQRQLEVAGAPAGTAHVDSLLQPDGAHHGVGPGACSLEADPGAVVAAWRASRTVPQRLFGLVRAGFVLRQVAFKLRVLRLYIAAAGFKCRLLGLQEPKVLSKHRRAAALGDQFLDQFDWVHGLPVRKMGRDMQRQQEPRHAA